MRELTDGWEVAGAEPGACPGPGDLDGLRWRAARVPGTVAAALADAGADPARDLDAHDWWFRTRFDAPAMQAGEQAVLHLDGIATIADVHLNGSSILRSESMFEVHAIDVGSRLRASNELSIRCHALAPLLRGRRKPRARWRTRLVADGELRWYRTMLLGRAPGFAPGPAAVGPWRSVWLERRTRFELQDLALRPAVVGPDATLSAAVCVRGLGGPLPSAIHVELAGPTGTHAAPLALVADGDAVMARGDVPVASVARWWPHTHGEPVLYDARLLLECAGETVVADAGRVGFRALAPGAADHGHDLDRDGIHLHANGVAIFARGAVWTGADAIGLAPGPLALRRALEVVRDAGMNMLRIAGTGVYEQPAFHDLCDELGILVWQDFMFANLDYPFADEAFGALVAREARQVLGDLAGRPSLAVLCGNSEVEQQATMFGVDPATARGKFFSATLPRLIGESGADAVYVPSAPSGGALPFHPGRGVANYYGVGGYRRPLSDPRAAGVLFATECLAFANVPDPAALEALIPGAPQDAVVHHPRWKAGVPRDAGAGWDFDDVRDHYLALLFGVDPGELRRSDHERYLELSRAVTGEVMSEVFGEWRRSGSPCGGGLVLWLRDLVPGAGWGVLDHEGTPKVAFHHLRRALAPVAVWTTDEGLAGVVAHVANDRPAMLCARLRIALYRDLELQVGECSEPLELEPHGASERNVEAMLGHFVDASWAYRFGPPAQDLIVASLERDGDEGTELIAQSFRFPAGRPATAESRSRLGIEASASHAASGEVRLAVRTRRLAYGVRVHAAGFAAADDAFSVEPGATRVITLRPLADDGRALSGGTLTALNLDGQIPIATAAAS